MAEGLWQGAVLQAALDVDVDQLYGGRVPTQVCCRLGCWCEVSHGGNRQGEVASYRWQVGLQAAANVLLPLQTCVGTAHRQLRAQLLRGLLDRMDDVLMTVVLRGVMVACGDRLLLTNTADRRARTGSLVPSGSLVPAGSLSDPGRASSMADPMQLRLPHSLLLFRGKVLTFGEGVALKMAISQWQQWAARQV